MINNFTSLIQFTRNHLTTRSWWDALRSWISLWILLVGIWFPLSAQETILQISFDGNSGFEVEDFPVIDEVIDGLEDVISPGILSGDDDTHTLIRRGPGLNSSGRAVIEAFAPNSFFACDFESSETLVEDDYLEIVIRFEEGVVVNLSEFKFYLVRTAATGPENMAVRSSVTGDTLLLEDDANATSTLYTIDLSTRVAFQGLTDSVAFRIYGWDGANDVTVFGNPIVDGRNRCMQIENSDDTGFDIELSGCINFPVLPTFTNPLAAGDTICSGDTLSVSLGASDSAGVEGLDYQFVLDAVQYVNGEGDTLSGYGPVTGGTLNADDILSGDPHIFEGLVNDTSVIVEIIYSVKTTKIGDGFDDCEGAVETFSVLVMPKLSETDIFWVVNGDTIRDEDIKICETDTIMKVILNNGGADMLAKYVINDTSDIFDVQIDPKYTGVLPLMGSVENNSGIQIDGNQEVFANNGIVDQFNSPLYATNVGKRYIQIALFVDENQNDTLDPYEEACPGDTITCTVEVFALPYLTEVELDTVCNEEEFSIDIDTQDTTLVEGVDYVVEVVGVFYDSDQNPLSDSTGAGYGPLTVVAGDSVTVGDSLTSPLTHTLSNTTAGPIRLTYRLQAKLIDAPECISPIVNVEVLVLPELPPTEINWVVNGDTTETADIMVCETDTIEKVIVKGGSSWLVAKYEITDSSDVFALGDSLKLTGTYAITGDAVDANDDIQIIGNAPIEEYNFNFPLIAANAGTRTIKLYLFNDANRNGTIEPFEEECESDTIECSVSVTLLPHLVQVGRDSVCSGDTFSIAIATQDTSLKQGEDYYLEVTSIRHDVDEDPFSNPLSPGQGYGPFMIQEGDSIKIGDTIQSPITQALVNQTSKPVRMRYRVKAVLYDNPFCESPEVNYEVMVWPKAPQYNLAWMINGEFFDQDSVTVCIGDTVYKLLINLSDSTDMIVSVSGEQDDEYVAAGDTVIGAFAVVTEVGIDTVYAVNFADANKNEVLDDQEAECPGDTLACVIRVIDAPTIALQPTPELDTVCVDETISYTVSVGSESGVWEGIWQCFSPGEKDFEDIEGEMDTTLSVTLDDSMKYAGAQFRFMAWNQCDTVYSDTVEIIFRKDPLFTNVPTDFIACKGDEVELTISATNADTLICQMLRDGVYVTDKSFNAIEPKAIEKEFLLTIDSTTHLRFIAANECERDTSDLTITVPDSVKITQHPADYATCQGDSVSFVVGVIAENGGEWQYWNDTTWMGTEESDTILTYLDVMGEMDGRMFRYCAYNECDTVYSDTVTLSVDTACDLSITDPCVCLGNESEPGAGDGQFSETFEVTGPAGLNVVIGAGSYGLYDANSDQPPVAPTVLNIGDTIPETSPGVYTLVIRAENNEEYSLKVAINDTNTVITDLTITKTCGYETPTVSILPSDTLVCVGDTVIFTTQVSTADSISIQTMPKDGVEFTEVKGVGGLAGADTSETYTISSLMASQDSMKVRVVAYNCGTAISDTAMIRVLNVDAGTLIPTTITCMDTTLDLFAVTGDAPIVPDGFDTVYVLTRTDTLIIEGTSTTPFFTVNDTGTYRIHTLIAEVTDVLSDDYLDLSVVELGVTIASEVLQIISDNNICADLDAAGALFEVERCNTIGTCDEVTITCELVDWDEDDNGADPYNHVLYFYESLINGFKGDDSLANRFTLDGGGMLMIRNDTAFVMGTASSKLDTSAKLDMMLVLTHPRSWGAFSSDGGTWLAQLPEAAAVADSEYYNWTYWIVDTTSRVVGLGSLSGTYLNITHAPGDSTKAMQQGKGANDKDGDIGLAGWFFYEGDVVYNGDTTYFNSQGDINSDFGNCDTICDLPIVGPIVTNFSANAVSDDAVQISWGTLTEGNGGYVVVERSIDGQIYEQVAVLEGEDGEFNPESHLLTDVQDQANGTYFYRLKVVKPDGTFAYTHVVQVSMGELGKRTYLVYPNPAQEGTFNIRVISPKSGVHYYEVYNLDGKRLLRDELNVYGTKVDISRIPAGMYFLRILDPDGEEFTQRIAVEP